MTRKNNNHIPAWQSLLIVGVCATSLYNIFGGIAKKTIEDAVMPEALGHRIEQVSLEYALPLTESSKLPQLSFLNPRDVRSSAYELPESEKTEENIFRLADALYLEGRGVHENGTFTPRANYLEMIAGTILERTAKGWRGAKKIKDTLGAKAQYSFTNKNDPQKKLSTKVRENARKNIIDQHAYEKCLEVAEDIIYNGSDSDIDHFYVDESGENNAPNWAIDKTPDKIFRHRSYFNGKMSNCITRCYNLF